MGRSSLRVAVVHWQDAYIDTCDLTVDEACALEPLKRVTVGFLVEYNANAVVLCTDYYHDDGMYVHAPMVIPKSMIDSIQTIEV